ncbi:MAG: MbnP family copper-binding protein [Myxococcota bacterium]
MFRYVLAPALLAASLATGACGDENSDGATGAFGSSGTPVTVRFAAEVGGTPFSCGTTYEGLGTRDSSFTPTDLRFFVQDLRLITNANEEVPVTFISDGKWQTDDVVLLDFEDGTNGCDVGNPDLNPEVRGAVTTDGPYGGVRFRLGVPFARNHADPATAPPPLNISAMWWSWNAGYKFIRLDGATENLAGWRFHLGSTMCEGDSVGNVSACANPNRSDIELTGFDPTEGTVVFDLATLLAGADLEVNVMNTAEGCLADANDTDCQPLFDSLGLAFGDGEAAAQTVFSSR